jgi:transcriptional regulator with XRE-family HTH domain
MQRRGKATLTPEEAFAKVLREIREERGLSQEALGYESNYHRTYIGMLERGLMNPSLRTVLSVSSALNIAPGEIVQRVSALVGPGWKQERKPKP